MALAAANWMYDAKHEDAPYHNGHFTQWSSTRSEEYPFHYRDGVHIWVSREDLTPEDDFI